MEEMRMELLKMYAGTLIEIAKEYEEQKFKNSLNKSEIKITVGNCSTSQKNVRMYDDIIEQWNEFCKNKKNYKKQDLISQALAEFMAKYR